MSAQKGQKIIWLSITKTKNYVEQVERIKRETDFGSMNFSKMCDLGSEIVVRAYNKLSQEEIQSIHDAEDFRNMIRSKVFDDTKENSTLIEILNNRLDEATKDTEETKVQLRETLDNLSTRTNEK